MPQGAPSKMLPINPISIVANPPHAPSYFLGDSSVCPSYLNVAHQQACSLYKKSKKGVLHIPSLGTSRGHGVSRHAAQRYAQHPPLCDDPRVRPPHLRSLFTALSCEWPCFCCCCARLARFGRVGCCSCLSCGAAQPSRHPACCCMLDAQHAAQLSVLVLHHAMRSCALTAYRVGGCVTPRFASQ